MNKSVRWQKIALSVLCIVLALVLIALIFATTYIQYLLGRLGRVDPNEDETLSLEDLATATEWVDPNYTGETVDPTDIIIDILPSTTPTQGQETTKNEEVINILLVGQDRRKGEPRQRSDAMILCTFNTAKKTITMTSFLRDSYVYIPGHGNDKLNAAYQFGGFSLLNETMAVNFGVHVDANVEVDFTGFADVIDLLGGVDITLTAAEAEYLNTSSTFADVRDHWNLKAGNNHLDGAQALSYSRIRYVSTGSGTSNDFGRTERQRAVISALLTAYKSKSLTQMLGLVDDVLPMVTTNMTDSEILKYVVDLFPMLSGSTITTQSIPSSSTYTDKYVSKIGSVLVLDLPAIRSELAELFETN